MKKILLIIIGSLFPAVLMAGTLTIEGTYTCQWQSSTPKAFKGTLESKGSDYEGDIDAPWNGKNEVYNGKLSNSGGSYSGSFVMQSSRRKFSFSISSSGGSCDVFEGRSKVGVLSVRFSGGSMGAGGYDYSALVSEAVGKATSISEEKVLALFEKKGSSKDDIIAVCAVAEVTQGDMDDLYKQKKKVNTNYEFLRDLKMDKETSTKVNDLIKKIKEGVETGKRKKK
ncbi:MAG: hypothetical protein A2044_08000 [Candidatus Firestonebacteria bacterium GWA2_43_8]|nr:MAG: hypothetical protein A2044_08000 [Candidatus Firestonebacteria bacterium GWA2_43_8]